MQNTLTDLNNHLFAELERLSDEDLSAEELQTEIARSEAIVRVAESVINNGELSLKVMRYVSENGRDGSCELPPMLETR